MCNPGANRGHRTSIALRVFIQLSGSGKNKALSELASGVWKLVSPDLSTPSLHGEDFRYSSLRTSLASPNDGSLFKESEVLCA